MAKQSGKLQAFADHEVEAAERMKWWGVFLVRERRRLQGIAQVVQPNGSASSGEPESAARNGYVSRETIEALLDRLDEEHGLDTGGNY